MIPKTAVGLISVIVLIVLSVPFQKKIDSMRNKFRSVEETVYFSSSALERISLGYEELLADIYWLRAIQYFGGRKSDEQNSALLYKYFDILTDLDPKFVNAYRFGGTFLTEPFPHGLGDLKRGTKLFDKGRKNNPNNFRIPLEEAFIYYLYEKDYEMAAELFKEASEKPGLSAVRRASLKGMAASAHSKGGNRELSKKIWSIIYESSPNQGRREFALMNLRELNTKDMEDRLTAALNKYIGLYDEIPSSLDALVDAGILKRVPDPPVGGDFLIAEKIRAVKSEILLEQELRHTRSLLTSKANRFHKINGRFPEDINELRRFMEKTQDTNFPPHPLGKQYKYDPETGVVSGGE